MRALIIDDTPGIHNDFRRILEPAPTSNDKLDGLEHDLFSDEPASKPVEKTRFEVDSAFQGEEGIEMVRRAHEEGRPYSIAFVDVRMPPGLNGIDTLARIWKIDPRIQAVICTAYSDHSWEDIIRTLGHSDGLLVLRKPFDTIEVLQVAHALSQKWVLSREVEHQVAVLEDIVSARTRDLQVANVELTREIAQRQRAESELKHLAMHDGLTGLPNRVLLTDRLGHAVSRSLRHGDKFGVMLVDLDRFKQINDTHGHAAGDELLKVIATRLSSCVRSCDTVARLGGDEFVVLIEELQATEGAAIVAQRVVDACGQPVDICGHQVRTPASIGIAMFPDDCGDAETLLKSADLAMYQAKSVGRGTFRFYAPDMADAKSEKAVLREELQQALDREELRLWYQPLTNLRTGAIVGMEALLRWEHPRLGLVPPMNFIPAAEASGAILAIGRWVLRTACRQLSEWRAAGFDGLTVSVNISPKQLRSASFVTDVFSALRDAGVPPQALELEISESAIDDSPGVRSCLPKLAQAGVRLVIDDFGAGHASLLRFKELPVHAVKIDRFFLEDVADDPRAAAIVKAIVGMAHSMGLEVVAEGIEHPAQLEVLRKMDWTENLQPTCDRGQGFLFSKPLPSDAASTLLRDRREPIAAVARKVA